MIDTMKKYFHSEGTYQLTSFYFLRGIGLLYFLVFWPLYNQYLGLLGEDGLLPIANLYPDHFTWVQFWNNPSLFWFEQSNSFGVGVIQLGLLLSLFVLFGFSHPLILFLLWFFQLSFVHSGQTFWGFGWETNLLEIGFLSIFMTSNRIMVFLQKWVLFRLMLGAGLIKLRGDQCWVDLTCLSDHFETQPIPNPLSPFFHFLPTLIHKTMVFINHFIELIVPFFLFLGRRFSNGAGVLFVLFQLGIMMTGNFAWINIIALVMSISCFDDPFLKKLTPQFLYKFIKLKKESRIKNNLSYLLLIFVAFKSIDPIKNLIGPRQIMNRSYDQFHFVNSYGVFGGITKIRKEVIIKGTNDSTITPSTEWKEYEIPCKPGNIFDRPCAVAPYHYRLTWQIWFAAMNSYEYNPWIINLVYKLLKGDEAVLSLLSKNPFPAKPPKYIKLDHYIYEFAPLESQQWYNRKFEKVYLPPLSLDNTSLDDFVRKKGWK